MKLSDLPYLLFVPVVAVVYYFAGKLILFVAALVFFIWGAAWFGQRFPRPTIIVISVLRGMLGRRW